MKKRMALPILLSFLMLSCISEPLINDDYNNGNEKDTIYISTVIRDSLIIKDTLVVCDTLILKDTLIIQDSVFISTIIKDTLVVCDTLIVKDTVFIMPVSDNPLKGKKIAIVGDSKSTISGNNQHFIKILPIDVGNEIQSWVTWWDVFNNDAGTIQTNKTIGGITIAPEMIGTKQTFVPNLSDVGKQIGTPLNYNQASTKVWSEVLCEKTGAILLSNASWSGSRICSGQNGQWIISEAWSDFTVGCCSTRDDSGNTIVPDIIIIARGTNDFSHGPTSRINDISLLNGIPETDYINGVYEFKAGYYKTIQKMRTAYPNALIVICTLNVFKRVIYDTYPTRNAYYTLPQMNDAIREIANTMGCGLIEFDKDGITFENCYPTYISDSEIMPTHPNSTGHKVIAEKAIKDLLFYLND